MRSGPLRHTITIQSKGHTKNAYGEEIDEWVDFATVRADVRGIASSERYVSQSLNSVMTKKFFIRYLDGITADMRIVHDTKVYDIDPPVDTAGKRRMLEIAGTEMVRG